MAVYNEFIQSLKLSVERPPKKLYIIYYIIMKTSFQSRLSIILNKQIINIDKQDQVMKLSTLNIFNLDNIYCVINSNSERADTNEQIGTPHHKY